MPEATGSAPAEPGWYAGVYDWKGVHHHGALHWDGERWGFDGPGCVQPKPAVVSFEPRKHDLRAFAELAALERSPLWTAEPEEKAA